MLGSLFVSIVCGIIGIYIVMCCLVFISGGIIYVFFGGIGLGLYVGIFFLLFVVIFFVFFFFGVEWLSKWKDMCEDFVIVVFWIFGMVVGIIFSFLVLGFIFDLFVFLFGNILIIMFIDILLFVIFFVLLILFFILFLNFIICIVFDWEFVCF